MIQNAKYIWEILIKVRCAPPGISRWGADNDHYQPISKIKIAEVKMELTMLRPSYGLVPSQCLTVMTKRFSLLTGLFNEIYKLLFSDQPLRRCEHHTQGLGWWELNSINFRETVQSK